MSLPRYPFQLIHPTVRHLLSLLFIENSLWFLTSGSVPLGVLEVLQHVMISCAVTSLSLTGRTDTSSV